MNQPLKQTQQFIVYVDTSYLTRMSHTERADWEQLLKHAENSSKDLNVKPSLEIRISEIALAEYRGKLRDELLAEIQRTNTQISSLSKTWQSSVIKKYLSYPFPQDVSPLPTKEQIESAVENYIGEDLAPYLKVSEIKEHHSKGFWQKYFNWESPFDKWTETERDDPKVREARRKHIPDAWILLAAIDAKNAKETFLCLCNDDGLSNALTGIEHLSYKSTKDVWDIIFPPPPVVVQPVAPPSQQNVGSVPTSLDNLLSKAPNENISGIYLRLLGFVVPLNTPTHESLVNAVVAQGYDKRLTEACAILLSDESRPYIKNTGSHYIAVDKAICNEASSRLTLEIIEMLNGGGNGN
ncbi:MAG: PIN domain-containing protein [Rickettsiales bacterium]